jgi:hypothetical protein
MSVFVQGRVPRQWNDETVSHLTRRLVALERELAGGTSGRDRFLSPAVPSFGSGTVSGGAGTTAPSPAPPATEPTVEPTVAAEALSHQHTHPPHEILEIVTEIRRQLGYPAPHSHSSQEIHDLQNIPQRHPVEEPKNPADAQEILASQVFGG